MFLFSAVQYVKVTFMFLVNSLDLIGNCDLLLGD